MTEKTIKVHMKQRRDTRANWDAVNPVLYDGELGFVSDDPNLYKIGDGETTWNDLPFRGFDGTISQETGSNTKAVMSQNAVTQELEKKQDVIEDLDQIRENANNALKSIPDKYVEDTELNDALSGKQDVIEDLDAIRSGAEKGATALQNVPEEYVTEEQIISNEKVTAAALTELRVDLTVTKSTLAKKDTEMSDAIAVIKADVQTRATQQAVEDLDADLRGISESNERITAAALTDIYSAIERLKARLDILEGK